MSKMSQLHAELEEQAVEKGYESLDHFLECGGEIDMVHGKLVNSASELDQAHEAWLEERESICGRLNKLYDKLVYLDMGEEDLATINDTIEFIKKGEC